MVTTDYFMNPQKLYIVELKHLFKIHSLKNDELSWNIIYISSKGEKSCTVYQVKTFRCDTLGKCCVSLCLMPVC